MERRLAAILAADVVGYSKLMAEDEAGTLIALKAHREELFDPETAKRGGRIVKVMGDGVLVEFPSVVDAVECAVAIQRALIKDKGPINLRIGVNLGDVIIEGDDLYGEGVNLAARLEAIAEPNGICVARNVFEQVRTKVDVEFEDVGEKKLKNIPAPVRVFRVKLGGSAAGDQAINSAAARRPVVQLAGGGLLAALLLIATMVMWSHFSLPDVEPASKANMAFALPDKPSIAVLPFNNMSDDRKQDYFADGMTEDLITDLSKISGLFVIARNSSFTYKDKVVKIGQVAEELGVRYVLEGSVRRAGDAVRINAQLIDATTGGHLWAERYDGNLEEVFKLQDNVTKQIVTALEVSLTGAEQELQKIHETQIVAAHDAFLQGWAHFKLSTPTDMARAIPFFEDAIRLDPDYAQAHAALASVYWDAYQNDWAFDLNMPSFDAEARATSHLENALRTPTPLGHALQSRIYASLGFPGEAVKEAEKAVALDGNNSTGLAGLAEALVKADRSSEAIGPIQAAMRLDPYHPPAFLTILGAAQFGMERYNDAASTLERAAKSNPTSALPLIYLASCYGHLGRPKEADNAIEVANDIRAKIGRGDVTLERKRQSAYSPFKDEVDFARFGGKQIQERLRAGLSDLPSLTWQYRVIVHEALDEGNTWFEVKGATGIDAQTAHALYKQGAIFIDTRPPEEWRKHRVPEAIYLTDYRLKGPAKQRLRSETILALVDPSKEVVVYAEDGAYGTFEAAKLANWGFQHVYFIEGGTQAWVAAGNTVEAVD